MRPSVSLRLFDLLLKLYPASCRIQYGPAMRQLFQDLLRDAGRVTPGSRRAWALAALWGRVLADLMRAAFAEHADDMRRWLRGPAGRRAWEQTRPWWPALGVALAVVVAGAALRQSAVTFTGAVDAASAVMLAAALLAVLAADRRARARWWLPAALVAATG